MGWYSNNVDRFRQLSKPYSVLFTTSKAIGGLGIGVLLANWLPVWTWWIFISIAVLIAVPVIVRISYLANKDGY